MEKSNAWWFQPPSTEQILADLPPEAADDEPFSRTSFSDREESENERTSYAGDASSATSSQDSESDENSDLDEGSDLGEAMDVCSLIQEGSNSDVIESFFELDDVEVICPYNLRRPKRRGGEIQHDHLTWSAELSCVMCFSCLFL